MKTETLITALVSGLAGALLAVFLESHLDRRADELTLKRDVLRRFVGSSFCLAPEYNPPDEGIGPCLMGEAIVALNEVQVVFADESAVREALLRSMASNETTSDNVQELIVAMATAAGLEDADTLRTFSPILVSR